jgi:hypothetical protein
LPIGVVREEQVLAKEPLARPKRLYVSCDGVMYPTRYLRPSRTARASATPSPALEALAALIRQRINHQWDAFWASRPLHRAA